MVQKKYYRAIYEKNVTFLQGEGMDRFWRPTGRQPLRFVVPVVVLAFVHSMHAPVGDRSLRRCVRHPQTGAKAKYL